VPDPLAPSSLAERIADALAPRYRVLSLSLRRDAPYQVHATDVVEFLRQFGFVSPVLVGEGLGCLTSLIVAAWFPTQAGALILMDARFDAVGDGVEARSLRDCPPDIAALRGAVRCPVFEAPLP
jgi:pimeloyl-ACP methyl ester carboxylesterase